MSNYYETLMIVRPTAEEEAVQAAIAAVRDHITAAGGEVLFESAWGKRRLAYAVADCTEGIYIQLNFTVPPSYPPTLERLVRLNDDIIRSLVIRTDGPPPPPEEVPNYLEVTAEPREGGSREDGGREGGGREGGGRESGGREGGGHEGGGRERGAEAGAESATASG